MPSPVYTEPVHPGEWLLSYGEGQRSRDAITVTVAANTLVRNGTVLGQITATKKFVPHNNAASDGSQNARAILMYDIPAQAAAGDVQAAAWTRDCEVWGAMLNGGAGVTPDVVDELNTYSRIIVR